MEIADLLNTLHFRLKGTLDPAFEARDSIPCHLKQDAIVKTLQVRC